MKNTALIPTLIAISVLASPAFANDFYDRTLARNTQIDKQNGQARNDMDNRTRDLQNQAYQARMARAAEQTAQQARYQSNK